MSIVLAIATHSRGYIEGSGGAQNIGTHQSAVANATQEGGLARFEGDEATEDVEHVHQLRGVFGEPSFGLNPLKGGRRAPIADDGPGPVAAAVAEPLDEYVLARGLRRPTPPEPRGR